MTPARAVHVVVFEGFADWEPAHALAELRRHGKRAIRTVGFTNEPVTSMGGLRILPDVALDEIRAADVELLLLPGGDAWSENRYPGVRLERLLGELVSSGTPIAAICDATIALARAGILNDRRHTSTDRSDLSDCGPAYTGTERYVDALAVRDNHVITASGLGAVDFARALFSELGVFDAEDERLWFDMYKHGRLPNAAH